MPGQLARNSAKMAGSQPASQPACRERRQGCHVHAAFSAFNLIVQVVERHVEIAKQLTRKGLEQEAFRRQLHAARVAVEQPDVERLFERAYQGAECRLR